MSVIPARGRLRQVQHEFKANLCYERPCLKIKRGRGGGGARAAAQMESLVAGVTDILDPSTEKSQQPKHTPSTEKSSKILENKNNRQMYALLNVSLWKETSWLLAACGAQFLFTLGRKGPRAPLHMQRGPARLSQGRCTRPMPPHPATFPPPGPCCGHLPHSPQQGVEGPP